MEKIIGICLLVTAGSILIGGMIMAMGWKPALILLTFSLVLSWLIIGGVRLTFG